ncbi:MAG TPA: FecR family protein [Candidatus Sulfotelmatobacter sp.]|nr:FecR family protein [Candidatus Sulfotelmatobacter sp.]
MFTRSSLSTVGVVCLALASLPAFGDSQARIVRLSDVQGTVQIDKNTGLGFENAFVNLPITQGTQLKTGATGRAEVEFEDGSTLRLTPNTSVHFSTLGLSDSGQRLSAIDLIEGMAYVNWQGKDALSLSFSQEKISLDHAAHFRVDTSTEAANVAVFKGDVDVEGPTGKLNVEKKKTATFNAADDDKSTMANKVTAAPFDDWDKEANSYHEQYAKNAVSSPYGYGLSDLNYYGSYSNVPGYGMMWQPYFAGVGWDPFMDGAWGFYPGFGYMFASAYPWGWLPYRYGNWMFVPGFGWMWQPGAWNTWVTVPHYTTSKLAAPHPLVAPTGTVRTVAVGKGGAASTLLSSRTVVRTGSAGMGISRGSVGNLGHLNHQVAKSGFAEVHPAQQFGAQLGSKSSSYGNSGHSAAAASSMGHMSSSGASAGHSGGGGSHR